MKPMRYWQEADLQIIGGQAHGRFFYFRGKFQTHKNIKWQLTELLQWLSLMQLKKTTSEAF